MPPPLLFHPIFDEAKASGGVSHGTVAHPAPEDRVDQGYDPVYRLGHVAPESLLHLAQERRPLLLPRRLPRTPDPTTALAAPTVNAQDAEGCTMGPVDKPALLLIDGDVQDRPCLSAACVDRLQPPSMVSVGLDQHHELIGKARVFTLRIRATAGDVCGPLQPPIPCREVPLTEQRGDHPPLWDSLTARCLPDALADLHHLRIVDPLGDLGQEHVGPHMVEKRAEIHVNAPCFLRRNRLGYTLHGRLRGPLRAVAV
jgi:hypothetical protein